MKCLTIHFSYPVTAQNKQTPCLGRTGSDLDLRGPGVEIPQVGLIQEGGVRGRGGTGVSGSLGGAEVGHWPSVTEALPLMSSLARLASQSSLQTPGVPASHPAPGPHPLPGLIPEVPDGATQPSSQTLPPVAQARMPGAVPLVP